MVEFYERITFYKCKLELTKMGKVITLILVFILNLNFAYSQSKDTTVIFGEVEFLPESIPETLFFIQDNIKYPETARKDSTQGTVFVAFFVEKNGETSEHKIVKGVRTDLDAEALRVSKLIRFKKPAINRGVPIRYWLTMPIKFILPDLMKHKKKGYKKRS